MDKCKLKTLLQHVMRPSTHTTKTAGLCQLMLACSNNDHLCTLW